MLTAFNMAVPGVPVIYYGDEIGMPGGGDPDNRRMMRFSDLSRNEKWVKEQTQKLVHLRRNSMSLMYGEYQLLRAEKDLLVFMRSYFNERTVVVLNKSNQTQSIALSSVIRNKEKWQAHFGHELKEEAGKFYLELPPYTFEVLTK